METGDGTKRDRSLSDPVLARSSSSLPVQSSRLRYSNEEGQRRLELLCSLGKYRWAWISGPMPAKLPGAFRRTALADGMEPCSLLGSMQAGVTCSSFFPREKPGGEAPVPNGAPQVEGDLRGPTPPPPPTTEPPHSWACASVMASSRPCSHVQVICGGILKS